MFRKNMQLWGCPEKLQENARSVIVTGYPPLARIGQTGETGDCHSLRGAIFVGFVETSELAFPLQGSKGLYPLLRVLGFYTWHPNFGHTESRVRIQHEIAVWLFTITTLLQVLLPIVTPTCAAFVPKLAPVKVTVPPATKTMEALVTTGAIRKIIKLQRTSAHNITALWRG